ncbi:MAG: alpha/beta hydrolase [Lactovum sp.]
MALIKIEYYSEVLGMNRHFNLIYPEASKVENFKNEDIPVLYLLHGMSGDHNSWVERSGIDRLARHSNLAIVMPSTDLGWYSKTRYGLDYFKATAEELPQVVHTFFPQLSRKREKTFIAGLSMGGYGAVKLALATDKFSHAASLSGALAFDNLEEGFKDNPDYWQGIFGSKKEFESSEIDNLDNLTQLSKSRPKMYIWCGKQDTLFPANERMSQKLKKLNYDLTYETTDGDHEWYYWSQMIDRVLEWLPINYKQEERKI